jgi:ribonuclease HI
MSDIRIWVETNHHAPFRCGGWAFVLAEGRALSGVAGGERTGSPERIALAGLAEALKGLPAGVGVEIYSTSPLVVGAQRRMADADNPPTDDLDLWAPIIAALKGRAVRFVPATSQPRTPVAFAAAWAELARDKAKNAGAFRAVIPKPNLAKAGVPA